MSTEAVSAGVICELLKGSILELCKASVPQSEGVEVDGIVCITLGKHTSQQLVVKIHELLWDKKISSRNQSTSKKTDANGRAVVGNKEKVSSCRATNSVDQRPNKRKSSCPITIMNTKQACLDPEVEDSEGSLSYEGEKGDGRRGKNFVHVSNVTKVKTEVTSDDSRAEKTNDSTAGCIEPSEVYVCEICKHCFSDHNSYSDHFILSEKCQVNFNICNYCNLKFYDVKLYAMHLKSHSSENHGEIWKGRPVRCGVCTVVLRSKRGIAEHMTSSHHHVKCYSCTSCDEIYPNFKTFKLHRNEKHNNVNQCRCEMCDLFFTFTEYKDHEKECRIKIYCEDMAILPDRYQMVETSNFGSPAADDGSSTNADVKVQSGSNASPGCESNDIFMSESNSILESPTIGPFRCQRCFMVFQEFEPYETHNHEMHSRYVCSYCAQSFATRRNLQRHARRHTGVRPYKCLDCSHTYTRDDDLKKHMFRHNHLTGYKGKSPLRTVTGNLCMTDQLESAGFNADSSNDDSVIVHQSQEPLLIPVNSCQEGPDPNVQRKPIDTCESDGNLNVVDDTDNSITIDDF